jgi:serine/threonine-protein kinase PpkA
MLTGKKPFDADNHMAILVHHAKAPIPKLPERIASLQPLIDTLMAKDPADRPANAAMAAILLDFALQARKAAAVVAPEATGLTATPPAEAPASSEPVLPDATPATVIELTLAPDPKT